MARVTVEPEGRAFECAPEDTLLRAALRAGLAAPYSCNSGSCGDCRVELLDGALAHEREYTPGWSERDRARNRFLGCQSRPLSDCRVKVRLDPTYAPVIPPRRRQGVLLARGQLTHDLTELVFAVDGPDDFLAGQYALFFLPGVDGARAYSMANLPGNGEWHFIVKRVPDGGASPHLFDALAIGDRIDMDGPYGTAHLRTEVDRDLLLLAGGSGLAPMISIARAASAAPTLAHRSIRFFYGGRTPADLAGEAHLRVLAGHGGRLSYFAALSGECTGWTGATGFIHDVAEGALGDDLRNHEIYFAGPPAMADAVQKMLHLRGVLQDQIHFDKFG